MKLVRILLFTIILIVVVVGGFLIFATIDDYKPEPQIVLYEDSSKTEKFSIDTLQLLVWNIGYCGMDKTIDFFYDGGTTSRVSKERTIENLENIKNFLVSKSENTDFFILQEIDKKAKRSYDLNQYDIITKALSKFKGFYGKNYDVSFIPIPISKPYGHVDAGLATFSKSTPTKVTRFQYPANFSWPLNLFMLDRCFLEERFSLRNGKELIVINLHNSAFDDGSLRLEQLKFLNEYINKEFLKGNYLILAGDWNQSPPNFKPNYSNEFVDDTTTNSFIDASIFSKDWTFIYSADLPTNRRSNIVYDKATTPTTVIDFFLISSNINLIEIENIDLNFESTDHQPVIAKFALQL